MSKFKFTCTNDDGNINTLEFEGEYIHTVLRGFQQFLSGAGYHFDGDLDFYSDVDCKEQPVCCDGPCKSEEHAYTMAMPGTIGSAELSFPNKRCKVCNLTAEQLGDHKCYDSNCGLK